VLTQVVYQKIFMQRVIVVHILQQKSDADLVNEALQQELPLLLDYLDHALQGKMWFAGDAFSMADVAVFTQLLALQMAEDGFDFSPWTNLSRLLQQMSERKSVQLAGLL
jgi:glutathione S-transferase